jgi:N-hydroxyarylamine O-acetyltransferase
MRVDVEGRDYLADVGFGGLTLTAPLRLEAGIEQATPHELHRIVAIDAGYLLEAQVAGEWQALYSFDLQPQLMADYEVSNWYLCHHPRSIFLNGLIAARAAPDARHALRDARYAIHRPDGSTEKRIVESVAGMRELLAGVFTIPLPENAALDAKLAAAIEKEPR